MRFFLIPTKTRGSGTITLGACFFFFRSKLCICEGCVTPRNVLFIAIVSQTRQLKNIFTFLHDNELKHIVSTQTKGWGYIFWICLTQSEPWSKFNWNCFGDELKKCASPAYVQVMMPLDTDTFEAPFQGSTGKFLSHPLGSADRLNILIKAIVLFRGCEHILRFLSPERLLIDGYWVIGPYFCIIQEYGHAILNMRTIWYFNRTLLNAFTTHKKKKKAQAWVTEWGMSSVKHFDRIMHHCGI